MWMKGLDQLRDMKSTASYERGQHRSKVAQIARSWPLTCRAGRQLIDRTVISTVLAFLTLPP